MTMKSLLSMVPVVLVVLASLVRADTNSCSFKDGECVYNVNLGQCQGQTQIATTGDSSCCSGVQAKYSKLIDDMEAIKLKVDFLFSESDPKNSSEDNTASRAKLEKALKAHNDILIVLRRREEELNATLNDLANTKDLANKEIRSLRDNMERLDSDLAQCRRTLEERVVPTPTRPRVTLPSRNYNTTYCSFNDDMCGFQTHSRDPFVLLVKMNKGSTPKTGPRVEHSRGVSSGYYLGLYSQYTALNRPDDGGGKDVSAKSQSQRFPKTTGYYCIMFWYYMRGENIRTLALNLETSAGTSYTLFSKTGPSETDEWQLARVDVPPEYASVGFRIDFNMSTNAFHKFKAGIQRLYNARGDIAVDDLYVMDTPCNHVVSYPSGAYIFNGQDNSTSYFTFYTESLNWFDAFDVCRQSGPMSALVSIDSQDEQDFLVQIILDNKELHEAGQAGYYTSGSDIDEEKKFVWTNTGKRRSVGDGFWLKGQPDNKGGNEDCLLMENFDRAYGWGDVDCNTRHPFICEATYPQK